MPRRAASRLGVLENFGLTGILLCSLLSGTVRTREVYYEVQMDNGDSDYADVLEVPQKIPYVPPVPAYAPSAVNSYEKTPSEAAYPTSPQPSYETSKAYVTDISYTTPIVYKTTAPYLATTGAPPAVYTRVDSYSTDAVTYASAYRESTQPAAVSAAGGALEARPYKQIQITYNQKPKEQGYISMQYKVEPVVVQGTPKPTPKHRRRKTTPKILYVPTTTTASYVEQASHLSVTETTQPRKKYRQKTTPAPENIYAEPDCDCDTK